MIITVAVLVFVALVMFAGLFYGLNAMAFEAEKGMRDVAMREYNALEGVIC